jgi:isochorismate hydrolase
VKAIMAIPKISPYQMPPSASLPANVTTWRPDPERAVLLLHDMQDYFLAPYERGHPPLTELIANSRALRDRAAALRIPVVYSAQPGAMDRAQRGLLHDFWGPGMAADEADTRITEGLTPAAADTVVTKWRYSAFVGSDLAEVIERSGRDQVVIAGVYASVGCLATAVDAFSRDIQPILVADAIADFSPDGHRLALDYAARYCAAVLPAEQVLAALAGDGHGPEVFSVRAETRIAADPVTVFRYVSDLSRGGDWSPECLGGDWVSGEPARVGSVFRGRNRRDPSVVAWAPVVRGDWVTDSEIVESSAPHSFAWAMRDHAGRRQDSVWSFRIRPVPGGSVLAHGYRMGELTEGMREIFTRLTADEEQKFLLDWSVKLEADVRESLARIKAVLESTTGRGDPL